MSSKNVPEAEGPRRRRVWSLAARLAVWYAGTSFALALGVTVFLYWSLVSSLDREDDQQLADKVHVLRQLLRDRPRDRDALRQEVEWAPGARQYVPIFVRILDEHGQILVETPGMNADLRPPLFPRPGPGETAIGGAAEVETPGGKAFRVLAARARQEGSARLIQVAFDRTHEEEWLAAYQRTLWLVLGLALVVCSLTGYLLVRRGLRPLARITATAERIRSTTLDERLGVAGLPAELAELAATFNAMLDRLQESFQRLARFSADIAHELRTPVNNLRGVAEVTLGRPRTPGEYRDALSSCLEECGRLARLIDSLLFLARAESPAAPLATEPVDVGRELAAVCEFYEAAAADAGVSLTAEAPSGVVARLDRTLFQRAVGNLVANALAHTPAGGRVSVAAGSDDGRVLVEVADTGRGIPPEHLPRVFDRFYRVDDARSAAAGGVGLGLSIVRTIATLHGGTATIASAPGCGTRVTLTLPAAREDVARAHTLGK
jgi:two-component system heavy metal sensor histidine kinase CusS